jgi:hypothetical protein
LWLIALRLTAGVGLWLAGLQDLGYNKDLNISIGMALASICRHAAARQTPDNTTHQQHGDVRRTHTPQVRDEQRRKCHDEDGLAA